MLFRVGIILAIGCITSCVSSDMCQVEDGASYRGKVAVTNTGKTCQRWDSQTPHGHTRTPANYPSSGLEQNNCRNPDGEPGVWCYTVDPYSRWEMCDVPICEDVIIDPVGREGSGWLQRSTDWAIAATVTPYPDVAGPDKVLDTNVWSHWNPYWNRPWYITFDLRVPHTLSKISITNFGDIIHDITAFKFQRAARPQPCKWEDVLTVTGVVAISTKQEFGGFSVTSQFWRLYIPANGTGGWQPWLRDVGFFGEKGGSNSTDGSYRTVDTNATYTSIGSPQLSIPACLLTSTDRPVQAEDKTVSSITCQVEGEASYRGKVTVTNTGKTCQHWDSQTPHVHYYTPGRYPSSVLEQNYCRNPDDGSGVWCYTVDPSSRWEYCDVPKCVSSYRDQHNKTSPPFKTVDGYGCPSGYTAYGRACFKAYNQVRNYDQARQVCAEDGRLLAMPKNKDLDNFLWHLKNDVDRHSHFWFGLNDQKNEGEWMWEDGSLHDKTADWNDWRSGQPDDYEGLEDCAHYHSTEGWNDIRCNATFKFICQLIPGLTSNTGSCEAAQVTASYTFVGGHQFSSSAYWDQSALKTTTAQAITNKTAITESYTEEMADELQVTYQRM